jgi:Ca2+-binding RTX toxin-like protein
LSHGDKVQVSGGAREGEVYEYLGDDVTRYQYTAGSGGTASADDVVYAPDSGGLYRYTGNSSVAVNSVSHADFTDDGGDWEFVGTNEIDFGDTNLWRLVLSQDLGDAAQTQAYIKDSDISVDGNVTLDASGHETIVATTIAGSVAIGGAGVAGIALSGSGVSTENRIRTLVKAFIDGDGSNSLSANDVTLNAHDDATIRADALAMSVASSGGGVAGVSVSIGIAVAYNEVDNDVAAYIRDMASFQAQGDIVLDARTVGSAPQAEDYASTGTQDLTAGDRVKVLANHSSGAEEGRIYEYRGFVADYVSRDGDVANEQTLYEGDTVDRDGVVYQYVGTDPDDEKESDDFNLSDATIYSGSAFQLVASPNQVNLATTDFTDTALWELADGTITARVAAASIAASGGGIAGVAVSGAGAVADNIILSRTSAYIANSDIQQAGNIDIDAENSSRIIAGVVAASVSVGGGGVAGVGASIGVSIAHNKIGYTQDGTPDPAQILAYIEDSSVKSSGDLTIDADNSAKIDAFVLAASAAIAGGGVAGVGASGAGVSTTNQITTEVKAYIDGDGATGILADSIWIEAQDTSSIRTTAVGASLAGGFAGVVGVSVSIGVALAENTVSNDVFAYIANADDRITATAGDVTIRAIEQATIDANAIAASLSAAVAGIAGIALSGAGADATNIIANQVHAYIENSEVVTELPYDFLSNTSVDRLENGQRIRLVEGASGVFNSGTPGDIYEYQGSDTPVDFESDESTPVALAQGDLVLDLDSGTVYRFNGESFQYTSATFSANLQPAHVVLVSESHVAGGEAGKSYRYIGLAENRNLTTEDFTDTDLWEPVTRVLSVENFEQDAWSVNAINLAQQFYLNDGLWTLVDPGTRDITVNAESSASINAVVGAVAGAVGGGTVGVAGSVGASFARNLIGSIGFDHTEDAAAAIVTQGDRVRLHTGQIYEFLGAEGRDENNEESSAGLLFLNLNPSVQDYANNALWRAIGDGADNEVKAYVSDSTLISAGNIEIKADADETIGATAFAGSVAISGGFVAVSVAGAGVSAVNEMGTTVHAYMEDSSAMAVGSVDVTALSDSRITDSTAVAGSVAIAAGIGGAVAVAVTLVDNTIANDVQAYIAGGANDLLFAGGHVTVYADVENARIENVDAVGVAVSGGLVAGSGVGVDIDSTIQNIVRAEIRGPMQVHAMGMPANPPGQADGVTVAAVENAYIHGDASSVSIAIGLGVAAGVGQVNNTIASTVQAKIEDAVINAPDVAVLANSTATIPVTTAVGIAGGLLAINVNLADARIRTTVDAFIDGATLIASGDVVVGATAQNFARALASGDTVGLVAAGAMFADITLGTSGVNDVQARLGDNTTIEAGSLSISAQSGDDVFVETVATSVGLVGVAGADSSLTNHNAVVASIGNSSTIVVDNFSIRAVNTQDFDSQSDSVAVGLGTGNGAGADNQINNKANINIGSSMITSDSIIISAVNSLSKSKVANEGGHNLDAGSASAIGITALESKTVINSEALVDLDGATLIVNGSAGNAGVFKVEAQNIVTATDSVRIESVSGFSLNLALSSIVANLDSGIDVANSTLENRTGGIYLATKANSELRPSNNLFAASALSGVAKADVDADNNIDNVVTIDNSHLKGAEIEIFAGRNLNGETNRLEASSNAEILAASLGPNIVVPLVTAEIEENNTIEVLGTSTIKSLGNVYLATNTGIGGGLGRASTDGLALSLSLVPYGMEVPDGSEDITNNDINIANTALIEAGLNNKALLHVLPMTVNGQEQIDPDRIGTILTQAELIALGLDPGLKYEYSDLDLDAIGFAISTGTVIEVVAGANGGGTVGNYYRYVPITETEADNIILENENYGDTNRWVPIDWNALTENEQQLLTVYRSDATFQFKQELLGKFYVIKPQELDAPTLTYVNLGNLLLEQRDTILSWMVSHATDAEAIARYQVQLDLIDEALSELGLLEPAIDENGNVVLDPVTNQPVQLVKKELDVLFLTLPNVYAAPGSVFLERDGLSNLEYIGAKTVYQDLVNQDVIVARPGAKIDIFNQTPFSMTVNDAIIKDTKRVEIIDGTYTVFEPGNVYFNIENLTSQFDSQTPEIKIVQDSFPFNKYDVGDLTLPNLDQDIYIVGDVINENGRLLINNVEGSIIVTGTLRAEEIIITAARDFTLNTDGWFHSNQDPRQYINYDEQRALALAQGQLASGFGQELLDLLALLGITIPDSPLGPVEYGLNSETPVDTELDELDEAIARDEARILAQGTITITARFLNINGLIQSGVDTIGLKIDASFNPGNRTTNFTDSQGNVISGISFNDDVPVDGYFDHTAAGGKGAIFIEDIIPQGGKIILAGQVLSTGNGTLRVANGYTNVDIENLSNYDLVLQEIDTTTNRVGKIIIIDTARIQKDEYVLDGTGIKHTVYTGELVQLNNNVTVLQDTTKVRHLDTVYLYRGPTAELLLPNQDYSDDTTWEATADNPANFVPDNVNNFDSVGAAPGGEDSVPSRIVYTEDSVNSITGLSTSYEPRDGLHYVWVDGQDKTQTTITKYEKNHFNLVGENAISDFLAADNSYKWRDIKYTDRVPLLLSETLEQEGVDGVPLYAYGDAFTIEYEEQRNTDISGNTNVTHVSTDGGTTWYKYVGPNNAKLFLPSQNYADESKWVEDETYVGQADPDPDIGFNRPELHQYLSSFENRIYDVDEWQTGGGWLRKKTYHTKITEVLGLKDIYTYTLKADYPIAIEFLEGPTTPKIEVFTVGNLFLEGDIESPTDEDGNPLGEITLTSAYGSVTSSQNVAIYGATPRISAGLGDLFNLTSGDYPEPPGQYDGFEFSTFSFFGFSFSIPVPTTFDVAMDSKDTIWVNIEGDKGPLSAFAAGDIRINAISLDNASSILEIGTVESKLGNVVLHAPNGIVAENVDSLIIGEHIELLANSGSIGETLAIRINSDIDGMAETGGISAKAQGDINIIEIAGDMKLVKAESYPAEAAIESAEGDVRLETIDGSILDGIVELFRPADSAPTISFADLSKEQKEEVRSDLISFIDGRYWSELTALEQEGLDDGTLSLLIGGAAYPVSPGLMSAVYPHTNFLGQNQVSTIDEIANIIGGHVTLIAGGAGGSVGKLSGPVSIDLTQDWAKLSNEEKELLSVASADEIVGVKYEFYVYGGGGATDVDMTTVNFLDGAWTKINTDYVTNTDRTLPQIVAVNGDGSTHVLVQFSKDEFGLYRYLGGAGNIDLRAQDYNDIGRWVKIESNLGTDSGIVDLSDDLIVANKYAVERLLLQLFDDIDIEGSNGNAVELTVDAGDVVGVDTTGDFHVDQISAGGIVRIDAGGSILDLYSTGTDAAITTYGDLIMNAGVNVGGDDGSSPFRIQLAPTSKLFATTGGDFHAEQVGEDADVRGDEQEINDLTVARIDAGGMVEIEVIEGNMHVGKITAGANIHLVAESSILDMFDDSDFPVVNLFTDGSTGDGNVFLQAGEDVGAKSNFLDVSLPAGVLTGLVTNNVYLYSPTDLDIGGNPDPSNSSDGLESLDGNISILVDGILGVGLVTANGDSTGVPDGLVTLQALTIIDRRNDDFANIQAVAAILKGEEGVGETDNALDTAVSMIEGFVPDGGFWVHNTGVLSIGEITGYADDDGFNPGGIFDDVNDLFDSLPAHDWDIDEEVGIYATGTVDISNIGDMILVSATVSGTEILFDAASSILDDDDGGALDVVAPEALLVATEHVGTDDNPIDTWVDRLEGRAGSSGVGNFFVDDILGLTIGGVEAIQDGVDTGAANEGILAADTIRVTTTGFMTVNENVVSTNADVTLHAIDSPLVDAGDEPIPQTTLVVEDVTSGDHFETFHTARDGSDTNDEDFILSDGVTVQGATVVNLLGGDDVLIDINALVSAGVAINIRGDHGDADPGYGTRIDILGNLNSPTTTITGGRDDDVIYLAPQSLVGNTTVLGDVDGQPGGDDIIIVNNLPSITTTQGGVRDTLTLDGRGGNDEYTVFTSGDAERDYIINVLDSGAPNDGADKLFIQGTDEKDVFLLRKNFVALLHEDVGAGEDDPRFTSAVERINYDTSINGRLRVDGLAGDDEFYSDDNSSITTIDGGPGDDFFQIGQVFGLDRIAGPDTMIAPGDEIETLETTLGFLSRGISYPTTILGGDGADRFVVYSNQALLKLFGEAGNDEFVVRAFVLVGEDGVSTSDTVISGGDGDDVVQYNINSPVSIDGGAGSDTVVVLGTELSDHFVITEFGVQGAGLNVDFDNVERLEVDGLEGDDHFYVLSTSADMVTTIIGGLGSDTINVGGDVTGEIVALSVEGRSGFVNHAVFSDDPAYNGIFAEGIQLNIANSSTGAVVITETGGTTAVVENNNDGDIQPDEEDSYTVKLSIPPPVDATMLYITVSAALAGFREDQLAGKTIELAVGDGTTFGEFSSAHVLTFDSDESGFHADAWDREVVVKVRGVFDTAEEGEQKIIVSHSSHAVAKSTGDVMEDLTALNIKNVEVTLYDNDKPGLIITQLDRSDASDPSTEIVDNRTLVFEGDTDGDFYQVSLTKAPNAGELVKVRLDADFAQIELESADPDPILVDRLTFTAASGGNPAFYEIEFDDSNWNDPFKIKVLAVDDDVIENRMRVVVTHSVDSDGGEYEDVLETSQLRVDVRDNDSAGIIVKQSNGSTLVSELEGDDYTIELTKQPTAPVQVQILTDGQTLVDIASITDSRFSVINGIPTVTFGVADGDWNDPFVVPLIVNPNADDDAGSQPVQRFPAQPHVLDEIRGPLIIEGGFIPNKDRSLTDVVMLPTEKDGERPIIQIEIDEDLQNDVLNVFADGSVSNDQGMLRPFADDDVDIRRGLEFIYEVGDPSEIVLAEFANINGLNMGSDLAIDFGVPGIPDVRLFAGGITYRGMETIEIMLGQGNDYFEVQTTLEGSITVVHGGGNSAIRASGDFTFIDGNTITRSDGREWEFEGFVVGQQVLVEQGTTTTGLGGNSGTFVVTAVEGNVLTLGGAAFVDATASFVVTAVDSLGVPIIGGDRLVVTGGGGELAPLILFGDTSQDGSRYNFATVAMTNADTTPLTFVHDAAGPDSITRASGSWWDDGFEFGQRIDIQTDDGENRGKYLIESISADGLTLFLASNAVLVDEVFTVTAAVSIPNGNARSFSTHGDDFIDARGATGGVSIYGGRGNDIIFGSEFGDHIAGGSGDDTIMAGGGLDHVYGDSGFNIDLGMNLAVATAANHQVLTVVTESVFGDIRPTHDPLTAGSDVIDGEAGDDIIFGDHGAIQQSAGTQRLATTGNVVLAFSNQPENGADDTLFGGAGNDLVFGGTGSDIIEGNDGHDVLFGDHGEITVSMSGATLLAPTLVRSTIPGVGGSDTIDGGDGNDIIVGGFDGDLIDGGAGDDVIFGDHGEVTVNGLAIGDRTPMRTLFHDIGGVDIIEGGSGNDRIFGGAAGDFITDSGGNNIVFGDHGEIIGGLYQTTVLSGGDDSIRTASGNDIIFGGAGSDDITSIGGNNVVFGDFGEVLGSRALTTALGGGNDIIRTGGGNDVIFGGAGGDLITASGGNNVVVGDFGISVPGRVSSTNTGQGGSDRITTGNGNDNIIGGAAGDFIFAGGGNDNILGDYGFITGSTITAEECGSGGDDFIDGGAGNDNIIGGSGSDTIYGGAGEDNIIGGLGIITGNNLTSIVCSDSGDNTIYGGDGDDDIIGGGGSDFVDGGAGNDNIIGDYGIITSGVVRTTSPNLGSNDRLFGGSGNDVIFGGFGSDFIDGGSGNDRLLGDNGFFEAGRLQTTDPTIGGNDLMRGGSGNDWMLGGFGDDTMYGDEGNDVMLGDNGFIGPYSGSQFGRGVFIASTTDPYIGGNDFLDGGPGNDIMIGGFGSDVFVGSASEDIMIGDAGVVIFTSDGIVLQVDAFGSDPLDRFSLFNLYSRDLDDVFWGTSGPGDDLLSVPFADAYAMQELVMSTAHRFLHHHEPVAEEVVDPEAQPEGETQPQDQTGESNSSEAVEESPTDEVRIDTVPESGLQSGADVSIDEEGGDVYTVAPGVSAISGSAVVLSLAGWRRKKAAEAQQAAPLGTSNRAGYRVYVDRTQMAGYEIEGGDDTTPSKPAGSMVFDTRSGKLRKRKSIA